MSATSSSGTWRDRLPVVLLWIAVAWLAGGSFLAWLTGAAPNRAREGDQCGPSHHWVYVRSNVSDPDLSCEADEP